MRKTTEDEKGNTYVGIIDDHGLESFLHLDLEIHNDLLTSCDLRARSNSHRNARVYVVEMDALAAKLFEGRINIEKKWKQHAREIKKYPNFRWMKGYE